ncbi:N-acetylmuramic acid 6-phosphate etherase [Alsobacter sp. SYSU M60028]|uniref:N-acetylmuramic acid 6-phosphate etherase n=1 Tax=Alsobacter ponti TaxID=2962936 RepID=A0ABT1L7Q5_9HYPH|nr:N-acetylmuramic acid 6-phosphate etherase [Alsobacter ponti]MCP8936968.1 N-acetylmuramic acid 6-phosphate etherase [Alsobacter ponti]
MATEDISARYVELDGWPTLDAVEAMYEAQLSAVAAVRPALAAIARAADDAAAGLRAGGRLVYAGAGTSGRVAVQDGAELPPTFDWPHDQLVFAMAGGNSALIRSAEGAEDDAQDAIRKVDEIGVGPNDVVIGLAASGTTPYTVAFVRRATERGAVSIGVANNAGSPLLAAGRHAVLIETGVEVVAGSTRMKAGTAQKIVLNLLSTAIMIRLGRVYRGMMVHMQATNAKLHRRAAIMVALLTGCPETEADKALRLCGFDVKLASLIVSGLTPDEAGALLDRHDGSLRAALADLDRAANAQSR